MKKKLLSSVMFCCTFLAMQKDYAQNTNPLGHNRCGTMENLEMLKQQDPGLESRMAAIEEQTQAYIKNNLSKTQGVVVRIPTVVHVVYANATQNLSDLYICQQIDVLNKDFRKLNADAVNIPTAFQSIAADAEIEFCLATVDPTGGTTTGIIHKSTTVPSFSTSNAVKFTAQGGDDAWDATKYLNLWVCNLGGGLLGYAQFPGGSPSTDGVVVLYSSLPGPPSAAPYDLGRTATHEIGHWFNLRHIWGDANCGDDLVSDTPTAEGPHYSVNGSGPPTGCPSNPYHVNLCGAGSSPNGENWQNYMDYTDDKCMFMFTAGQKLRMQATINGIRASILTAANTKCGTGNTPNCPLAVNELISENAISIYPNPTNGNFRIMISDLRLKNAEAEIYNVYGEKVYSQKISNHKSENINLEQPNGIYLFKIQTSEGIITRKIVMNR